MIRNKLPPLQLNNSETSVRSSGSSNPATLSARERRRMRKTQTADTPNETQTERTNNQPDRISEPASRSNRRSRPLSKPASLVNDTDQGNTNQAFQEEADENENTTLKEKPPRTKRRARKSQQLAHEPLNESVHNILEGLEEDVIEMDDVNRGEPDEEPTRQSSQRDLITGNSNAENESAVSKSVPTDKFYLELEKKFEAQKKELFEKREQERLRAQFEWQLKQKQKESQKYQISTPKYALNTHKFLRTVFLFIHGINVGFQFWQIIVLYYINYSDFVYDYSAASAVQSSENSLNLTLLNKNLVLFENLAMPIHSLSYFFLTICIVDSIDRVDLAKINLSYLVKCISFQNQFWSIIAYLVALVASLSLINVDETVYSLNYLTQSTNVTYSLSKQIANTVNSNASTWQSLNAVKAGFSLFAWFLFSILIGHDKTCESLEKRDFSILDDLASQKNKNDQKPADFSMA